MKFDKQLTMIFRRTVYRLSFIIGLCLLVSCGGLPIKKSDEAVSRVSLPKEGTLIYIPVQKVGAEGEVVPYQSMENPYLTQAGQVDAAAIDGFIAARRALKKKDYKKADALLDSVVETSSDLAGPWVMKGDIALLQKRESDAATFYQNAIEANKLNVNAYTKLAKTLRLLGRYQESLNTYVAALEVWKDFPEAHLNLAVLYDIYLNDPLLAQRHMEAYQFLTKEKDKTVAGWLEEIKSRTGAEENLVFKRESSASQISSSEGENLGS